MAITTMTPNKSNRTAGFFSFSLIKEGATGKHPSIYKATEVTLQDKLWFHRAKMCF
jgi:hypothetical protein